MLPVAFATLELLKRLKQFLWKIGSDARDGE